MSKSVVTKKPASTKTVIHHGTKCTDDAAVLAAVLDILSGREPQALHPQHPAIDAAREAVARPTIRASSLLDALALDTLSKKVVELEVEVANLKVTARVS